MKENLEISKRNQEEIRNDQAKRLQAYKEAFDKKAEEKKQ